MYIFKIYVTIKVNSVLQLEIHFELHGYESHRFYTYIPYIFCRLYFHLIICTVCENQVTIRI